ncbi:MAG: DEAD/DEAH box helicase [Gammaproteobacteria bacterium]|nr:DEAD/DEAH box helicase [Gammaproteobacteria bacterium]
MTNAFKGWKTVAKNLCAFGTAGEKLNEGQAASLRALAKRLPNNGVIIADEVGMGKTRIAAFVAKAVTDAGGRVAILVPPGLGYQWRDELRVVDVKSPPILRSLWQYLQVWEHKEQSGPWFEEKAIIVSHAFINWRLGENSEPWRWALLPEIYARWRKQTKKRLPDGYTSEQQLDDQWVKHAAESIVSAIDKNSEEHKARKTIEELADKTPWPGALIAAEYKRDGELRPWLERAVGLGLGVFDLVIIDEAHKAEGKTAA